MWTEKLMVRKSNPIQALYPSCKLVILILFFVCTIVVGTIRVNGYAIALIPWFAIVPVLCAASGIWRQFCKAFRKILFIMVVIFIVQSAFMPGGDILWRQGPIRVYDEGVKSSVLLVFLIANIAGIFIWLFQTTRYKEMSRALEDSGLNNKAAYIFVSTLQMINILGQNSKVIMDAQRARGVETDGGLPTRAKAFFPTIVPLVLSSLTGAEERALTLEAKGFDVVGPKTHMFVLKKSGRERTALIAAGIITAAVIAGRGALWVLR